MSSFPSPGLNGIWPALLTPLDERLDIDGPRFASHARQLLDAGCAGVTPFGTTGEGPSFSVAERIAGVDALLAGGVPASRVLVSTSCAALPDVVALTRHAVEAGAWGCLMMPPFFLKGVPEQGVVDAFSQVIDRVADARLRLVVYHLPQVGGVPLTQGVVRALLARYPQTIVAIKDSGCKLEDSLAFAAAFMPPAGPLGVHVGNEPDLPTLARLGSRGAVSGLANFMPRLVQRLVAEPDSAAAVRDLERVQQLLAWLGGYALGPALKAIMALKSGEPGWLRVRAPLLAIGPGLLPEFERGWRAIGIDPDRD
ncbi:dihydrodipicolinate synthase family protein [Sphaerotilus microaerophilus]|uniref:Dihydrodipicolinate synthase family protein n=1 Tax=Sphaerotilus microaerophilus TaxID=2914710 RepID=A0ABM7YT62_9BURK|nr:dihydrodipicolinate synthase family protein [Sphaerotilus sp. FB-5]BDI07843.1 dihydrodipicolinate synthase family protein [Sphaerotilus sp. FB-5]